MVLQLVIEDNDTDSIQELEAMRAEGLTNFRWVLSGARNCNEAINIGFRASTEPFFTFSGDDVEFVAPWLETLLEVFEKSPEVQVSATWDGLFETGKSLYIMRREYIEKFGTIDCPGEVVHGKYAHCWVDNEFLETAEARGVFQYCRESLVQHHHYAATTGIKDRTASYLEERSNNTSHGGDHALYQLRRRMWIK